MKVLRADHIAIAVKDIEQASMLYKEILGLEFVGEEVISENNVKIASFKCGELNIELIQQLHEGDSSVGKFIEENGEGLYHIAFEVDNLADTIESLTAKNFRFQSPCPMKGAKNSTIAFLEASCANGTVLEFKEFLGKNGS